MAKAFFLGIMASFFFAFTFIFNHQMNIQGGSWYWSSSLRYLFMLPILFVILAVDKQLSNVIKDIIKRPVQWIIWSTVGFGLFYAPLSFASVYGESWLIAATWQITIIAGVLMSPLFYKVIEMDGGGHKVRNKIPGKSLIFGAVILIGIFLVQLESAKSTVNENVLTGIIPVLIAAFAYPLGNRKMIEVCNNRFNTLQRVFGMTLCSMPFWIVIAGAGYWSVGLPVRGQITQSLIVAIFSGIIATILFFKATDIVSKDMGKLAVIESTQSGEVIFTLLGGVIVFHDRIPSLINFLGIFIVVTGMVLNSLIPSKNRV